MDSSMRDRLVSTTGSWHGHGDRRAAWDRGVDRGGCRLARPLLWDSPRLATPRVPSRSDVSVFRVACYGGLCAAVASGVAVGRTSHATNVPRFSLLSHVSLTSQSLTHAR